MLERFLKRVRKVEFVALRWLPALALTAIALLAACDGGGGVEDGATPTATATATATVAPSSTSPPSSGGPGTGSDVTPPPVTPGSGEGPEPEGRIVFLTFRDDDDREIYSVNVDGSDVKNLTNSPGVDENPDVSPDGKHIVWASDRNEGRLYLYVMNIDGKNVRRLTTGPGGDNSPRWSRDGKKVAFARGGEMLVVDAAGGEPKMIFQAGDETTAAPCKSGAFPGGWSPDDSKITYYSASVSRGIGQVCTVTTDGSKIDVLVGEPPVYNVEPTWSADGRHIAFRSIRGNNHDVYVYDFETGQVRRLTDHPGLDIEPNWSPDGEWITFGSGRDNDFIDIYIMRKDGSDVRRVTDDPAKDSEPVWVP